MKFVERVEEPLLRLFFGGDELDVVYQEGVGAPVTLTELVRGACPNCLDVVVREPLAAYVDDLKAFISERVADGVQQVGLAEAYLRVDIERVVDLAGGFRDPGRGGVGELVRIAYDKGLERETGPKTGPLRPNRRPDAPVSGRVSG